MAHFRVRRGDDSFAGGEWATREAADRWARKHIGAFWYVVETDRFGNPVPSSFARKGEEITDERSPQDIREGTE